MSGPKPARPSSQHRLCMAGWMAQDDIGGEGHPARVCSERTVLCELVEKRHELAAHKLRLHGRRKLRQVLRGRPPHLQKATRMSARVTCLFNEGLC